MSGNVDSRRTGSNRSRSASPTQRYSPRDTVRAGSGATTRSNITPRSNVTSRIGATRVVPRSAAPRLGTPLRVTGSAFTRNAGFGASRGYRWGASRFGCSPIWNGWWNAGYCYRPWSYGFGLGLGWGYGSWGLTGCNPFWWQSTFLSPWWAYQNSFWYSSYSNCYWNSWTQPGYLSSGYWWYPTSTYYPTFLSVPSSVFVAEEPIPATDGGTTETIVAGGSVVGDARAVDESAASEPLALAAKYVELGDFYFRADRFADAAEAYAKARSYAPNDASVHFVMADAVFANGDYHYAAFLIAEAVRLDRAIVSAVADKRDFYGEAKTFDDQMAALQRYLDDKPYDAWAQLLLAYNLRFSDRPTAAIATFRRVLELDRGNQTAQAFLDQLTPAPEPVESGR